MEVLNIGSSVSFYIESTKFTGTVIDVLEIAPNDNVYVVETRWGKFNLDNSGEVIL